jgi:hypothetical protein
MSYCLAMRVLPHRHAILIENLLCVCVCSRTARHLVWRSTVLRRLLSCIAYAQIDEHASRAQLIFCYSLRAARMLDHTSLTCRFLTHHRSDSHRSHSATLHRGFALGRRQTAHSIRPGCSPDMKCAPLAALLALLVLVSVETAGLMSSSALLWRSLPTACNVVSSLTHNHSAQCAAHSRTC